MKSSFCDTSIVPQLLSFGNFLILTCTIYILAPILVFHYIEQSEDGDSDFSEYKLYDYDFNLIREGKVPDNKLYCAGIDETGIFLEEFYWSDTRDYYKVYRIPTTAEGEEELLIDVVRDVSMFNVHGE